MAELKATSGKEALEGTMSVLNIEKEQLDILNKQNSALKDMVGLEEQVRGSIVSRLEKEGALKRELQSLEAKFLKFQLDTQHEIEKTAVDDNNRKKMAMQQQIDFVKKKYEIASKLNSDELKPYLYFMTETWKLFESFDKSAASFRKEMGMTRAEADSFRKTTQRIAVDFMHVGVTIEGANKALTTLGDTMGGIGVVSDDLVKTTALLNAQLGVSEETTTVFLRNMAAISGTTMQAQQQTAYMAASLANAATVPLGAIMKDVASRSDTTLTMMSRIPSQVIKTAVEMRRMGTTLDNAAKSSRSILNFTESVNAEMEASVLLGQSVNLQKARELAYKKDLIGSTNEILKLTKQVNFEKLDVFQQEAFAKATGKSVDELLGMVQAEKQWSDAKKDPKLKDRVAAYEKLKAANDAVLKDKAKQFELELQQKNNQARMEAIQQKWNQAVSRMGELFLPVIDAILSIVPPMIDFGVALFKVVSGFGLLRRVTNGFFSATKGISLLMGGISTIIVGISTGLMRVGRYMETAYRTTHGVHAAMENVWRSGIKFQNIAFKLSKPMKTIAEIFSTISNKFPLLEKIVARIMSIGKGGGFLKSIFLPMTRLIGVLSDIFPSIGKFAGLLNLGKSIPVLGEIIMAIQGIYFTFKRIFSIFDDIKKGDFASAILKALTIGPYLVYKVLVEPIVDLIGLIFPSFSKGIKEGLGGLFEAMKYPFNLFLSWFGAGPLAGHSPSDIGLSILKGIVSVGSQIFDALTSPFRQGLSWILKHIPGMGKFADMVGGGASGVVNKIKGDDKSTVTSVPINAQSKTLEQQEQAQGTAETKQTTAKYSLDDIYDMLNTLNNNLISGKVKAGDVYLDSSMVSTKLAQGIAFKGSFGTNR